MMMMMVPLSGKLNVKDEELDEMLNEGKGPINFTVFLSLFGEKLNGEHLSHKHFHFLLMLRILILTFSFLQALTPKTPFWLPSSFLTRTGLDLLIRTSKINFIN